MGSEFVYMLCSAVHCSKAQLQSTHIVNTFNLLLICCSFSSPPQCELYHWVDLLDRFDGILADAGQTVEHMSWMLVCDRPEREQLKMLLLAVLNFTALLIEYSFSRHLYSSIEVGEFQACVFCC